MPIITAGRMASFAFIASSSHNHGLRSVKAHSTGRAAWRQSSAKAVIQFRKSLSKYGDIFRARCLEFPQVLLVNVGNFAGLDTLEKLDQPLPLLMPILSAH